MMEDARTVLERLIRERREDCASLSRLLGRNPTYVQQFIRRGSPRRLAEQDRERLARYFGVPETWLGAQDDRRPAATPALLTVPVLDTAASAGPGAVGEDRLSAAGMGFSEAWLRKLRQRGGRDGLSVIRVRGDSMEPTLADGDEILVDESDRERLRDGIYVLRVGDVLLVKRLVREGDGFAVRSDNPAADPVDLSHGVNVIGRVLWAGRKL
jgi:phage repressor protein C with HTH and peptisase S24 domain